MSVDALFAAVKAGDAARVESMLQADPALASARDEAGMSAVLTAAYWQQPAIVAALLAHGPGLDLYEAAAAGVTARVEALLAEHPELVAAVARDGFTALGLASFFGHRGVAALLLERGANPNQPAANAMGVAPLHSAAAGSHLELARLLLDHGAAVGAVQEGGFTALHSAAQNGNADLAALLLERGADPQARTAEGRTPRDLALEAGHPAVAALL